ncbi:MAG: glycoside hydrolase domain-containing protein [Oligosphaeraceae bacterium]
MKKSLLLLLALCALPVLAAELLLYESVASRPPELDWRITANVAMAQVPWPNGESGLTVKFTYTGGADGWPSGKYWLPENLRDWRKAKTLNLEIYCDAACRVGLVVATYNDSSTKSLGTGNLQFSPGRHKIQIDMGELQGYDISEMKYIDVYCSHPQTTYSVYVGDIYLELNDPEEEAAQAREISQECQDALRWRQDALQGALPRFAVAFQELAGNMPETPELEQADELRTMGKKILPRLDLHYFQRLAREGNGLGLRWCMPEEKVLRDLYTFLAPYADTYTIEAARGEGESAQLVAYAIRPLQNVQMTLETLPAMEDGTPIPAEALTLAPVGYVLTSNPAYKVDYIGYWPDPILEYLQTPVSMEAKTYQSWWLDVQVPQDQKPGLYQGSVKITYDDGGQQSLPFSIRVHEFTLAQGVPYFSPVQFIVPPAFPQGAEAREKYWQDLASMLIAHRLQPDDIYLGPDRDNLVSHAQWLLDHGSPYFNLGFVNTEVDDAFLQKMADAYQKCADAGIADHAYIYCYDEKPADMFPMIRESLLKIRQVAPGVPTYTTLYDGTFGRENGLDEVIDAWIPLTVSYGRNQDNAILARERGDKVGWYVCCTPTMPYANFLLEHPATANRLLMGFMKKKYGAECFLYYQTSVWRIYEKDSSGTYVFKGMIDTPVTGGPILEYPWIGESFQNFPGDGRLLYPAADGPIPTTRIKSIRDGAEDWMYLELLAKALENADAMDDAWRDAAAKELQVEDELVRDLTSWTTNPALVQAKKLRLAALLDQYARKNP